MFAVTLAAIVALPGLRAADDKTGQTPSGPKAAPAPARKLATFDLRLVGPDGKPVPEAKVELRNTPSIRAEQVRVGKYQRQARYGMNITSDSNGRIVFERPADWKHFDIFIEIPGFAPYWAGWDPDRNSEPIPADLTVKLDAGWRVGGIVVDSDDKPITGAQIWPFIEFTKRPGELRQLLVGTHLRTDSDGKWTYQSVPISTTSVRVEISKHGFMTSRPDLARGKFGFEPGHLPLTRIVLKPGLIVTGKVIDGAGKPIDGAVVRTKFGNDLRKAVTGADGTYTLGGCEPGEARIVASAKARATEMRQVAIGPGATKVDFEMQPGRTIRIRVLDERGSPVPKARIFFQTWRGPFQYFEFDHVSQYAYNQGAWEWREAPVDMFAADICRPGGMPLSRQPLIARKEEYVFRVPPALVVSGKVVDAQTKQPIKKFRVIPGMRGLQTVSWNVNGGFTSVDGQYRIRETYGQSPYAVRIEADGYLPSESRAIKSDEGNVTVDFELVKGKDVAGTVLTPAGIPAAGAKVALGVAGSRIHIHQGEIDNSGTTCAHGETDPAGRFHFGTETADFLLVITHPSGYARLNGLPNSDPKVIRLSPWARVEGTLRVARKPQPGVNIRLDGRTIDDRNGPLIYLDEQQRTDPSGRFVFERVVPGRRRIGRYVEINTNDDSKGMTSSGTVMVNLTAGKTTHIDLGASGRPVIGQLQRPTDSKPERPLSSALIGVRPDDPQLRETDPRFRATVDSHGRFCIDDVPVGNFSLSVRFVGSPADGLVGHRFSVPAINEKLSQRPVDLGVLTLEPGARR